MAFDSPAASMIPSKVTSAWQPAAIAAPSLIALSACSEPSLQINIFIFKTFPDYSFSRMSAQQPMNDNHRPDQWKRNKGHADARPDKKLRAGGPDLRANGSAGVHDQRNQNIHIAFERVTDRAVAGRDNYLK